ncbi:ABC transporter ATP-binding protein [Candidatus Deferrimicrobium sp.]|uniref:ABC transporter ATP-binding protein n=1 Tax=Candidatus Deferrimicrobium sp. TaxID=3060586 RepID=UPI002ED2DD01
MLLTVDHISVYYGGIRALREVSFTVGKGEIVTLIGANGAGKSTTLRAISGVVHPAAGRIVHGGKPIVGLPPHQIVRQGIAHVPEGRGVFANMSVRENLEMGAYTRSSRKEVEESFERVFGLFPRLAERMDQFAGTLSGGEQQMLAIGRGLIQRPDLLLLDEPSMGLSPLLVGEIFKMIAEIKKAGMTILLVEQNATMALAVADRAYVIETGEIALEGKASDLREDPKVRAAYLGDVTG